MVDEALKDAAGEATESITGFVGGAGNDLGDALTFWD
jgi:hypothetical protein